VHVVNPDLPAPWFVPPTWASAWGEDEFGLWAEFEYQGVVQRMRWIPPGKFWMGSPEDEPERDGNEVVHEVELTQGYWLADTACSQDLWVAVMGENPSRFKEREEGEGPRPVEQVSWEDCQVFCEKLNQAIPELNLRLPTEAEWENACRAGTRTPFSLGRNITTEQVNYDGNYPYAGGVKGEYRGKTVPVKFFAPPNPWGFYEMHGNVWEWCLDWYGPYPSGTAIDPVQLEEDKDVRDRVVRGGSWYNLAGGARSACRSGDVPGVRYNDLGFRFARGRSYEPDKQAEGARGPSEVSGASRSRGRERP
jgi:formylglycine-generating enzyme required for sulfatase activity